MAYKPKILTSIEGGTGASNTATSGKVLVGDGTNFVTSTDSFPTVSSLITTFNASNTWTMNSRSVFVEMYIWSGGGGGGSGRDGASTTSGGGGGGGGGTFFTGKFRAADLTAGSPYTITIGAGGAGGTLVNATTTNGNPGTVGGTSSVGTAVIVPGSNPFSSPFTNFGAGGISGSGTAGQAATYNQGLTSAATQSGGTGNQTVGNAAVDVVLLSRSGGAGGVGYTAATPRAGQPGGAIIDMNAGVLAAGGLAGSSAGGNGGNGNTVTGSYLIEGGSGGGSGGHDGTVTAGSGGNGATPGGGGGGGAGNLSLNNSGAGGTGGDGKIIIIEYF